MQYLDYGDAVPTSACWICRKLILVTNFVLLSSFFGLYVECKNMHDVSNVKFLYKRVPHTRAIKRSTCSFHLDISGLLASSGNRVPLQRWLIITFYKMLKYMRKFLENSPWTRLNLNYELYPRVKSDKMNPAICDVSRSLQRMFGLKFLIKLMIEFNKVSHITFLPYKFRQGLISTLFLIFYRSQELWSESSVGVYFLQHSSDRSCIFYNTFVAYT
jgi:hypothetical protein